MRYLKTLLVAVLASVGMVSYAQTWTAEEIGEGTYFLYNVGKGMYFAKGNNWGSQASMAPVETNRMPVEAKLVGGAYFLRTGLNGTNNGLEWLDSYTMFVDQSRGKQSTWTFTKVGDDNGPVYNIVSAANHGGGSGAYLTASADNTVLGGGTDGSSDYAKWKVISVNSIKSLTEEALLNALASESVDATSLILNPNFSWALSEISGWNMQSSNQNLSGGCDWNEYVNPVAESWLQTFTLTQNLQVPNGAYQLKAQAACHEWGGNNDGKDWPVVYANDATSEFNVTEEADRFSSMGQMSEKFTSGKYEVKPINFVVSNGSLTIGARSTRTYLWQVWDNFRLEYKGMAPLLKDLIDKANELMPTLNETNAAELQKAIDAAQAVYDNASSTNSQIEAAMEALQSAYDTADAENIAKRKAIAVLNNVPYVLFPENFKWALEDGEKYDKLTPEQKMDINRAFKVYKNNNGKYQLASRIAVAALVKLLEYADADEKTKKVIKARLDELGIEGYDEMLADAITTYTRLVVESHGVGAALGEQGDPNYSRMYAALEEAGVDDTDAFIDVLLNGASDASYYYVGPAYDADVPFSGNTWTSSNGLLTITNLTNDISYSDYYGEYYPFFWSATPGDDWKIQVNDPEVELYYLDIVAWNLNYTVNDGAPTWARWYDDSYAFNVSGQEAILHINEVPGDNEFFIMAYVQDSRNPWKAAAAEKTTSDIYEMLHDYFDGLWGFDANFTAHIQDPNLTEGGEAWEVNGWGILDGEPLTDSEGNTEYPYFDANTWNESGTMEVDAHQTIQLPPGRYMLTAAGRASEYKKTSDTATRPEGFAWPWHDKGFRAGNVWEPAFTEAGAQDPSNYFQLYATTYQGTTISQSFLDLEGNKGGIFDNGWNDASVFFTMPSVGDVTIGVRAATNIKERWASATRFRLTRLGDATIYLNEDETLSDEFNWDAIGNEIGAFAPTDFLLKKEMQAGKWYSIALPGDVSNDQIVREFGEGTLLALPIEQIDLTGDGANTLVSFLEYDPTDWRLMDNIFDYGIEGVDYPMPGINGIMANVPFLIKPAKVKPSNRYLFKNITSTETKNVFADGEWSWGALSLSTDPDGWWFYVGDSEDIKFYPNYKYGVQFPDGYTIEFCDTLKAYTAALVSDKVNIVGAVLRQIDEESMSVVFGDDVTDIIYQQMLDAIALGQQKAEWYPGIPAAMTKKITTIPELDDQVLTWTNALSSIKTGLVEAQKAYEPSKQFNALMAEAEELLNSDHNELVAGADAAFKKKIEQLQKRFDMQLKADPIYDLIESLEAAIAEYKEQIFIAGTIEDANYYILNVGTGKYLNGGNSWGTRASLTDNREYFTTAKLEDGTYTLESRFSNGGEQYYLGPNYYVDNGNPMHLTITPVSETAFTISCTGDSGFGYLGWDGSESTEVRVLAEAADENAQWTFVPVADVLADIPNATVEEPKDATPLIKDAYFGRNHREASAWEGEGAPFGTNQNGNTNAEKWGGNSQTFDIHQTVAVPDGVYRLTFFGYYRYNNTTDNTTQVAIDTHKDGTEVINSFVYANDVEVALKSIADEKAVEVLGEANLPFSQDAAGQAFAQGLYKNEILVKVEGGKLVLGIKKIDHPGCDWTVWDDFILTYYGDTTIEDVLKAYPVETGTATGITEVNTGVNTGAIFNLNGVRVNNMTKKGVYIVNGKKVVVK